MKRILYPFALTVLLASCGESAKERQLRMENDSLMVVTTHNQLAMDELLSTINDVEDGFKKIKETENYLTVHAGSNRELPQSTKERLAEDMQMIQEILKNNKERIDKLQKVANQSEQMKKTIARLNEELNAKTTLIINLQGELQKRDVKIQQLTESVTDLAMTVDELTLATIAQQQELEKQEAVINAAWYVFGTKKELREQKILSGNNLMTDDFNKSYFTTIDVRKLKEIPLHAKKAKMLSNMPEGSYTFVKGADDRLTLVVNNYIAFWSLSKYLVVQVD